MENYTIKETLVPGNPRYYNSKRQLHRLDGPAAIWSNNRKEWYINGKLHRLDGPALMPGIWRMFNEFDGRSPEWRIIGRMYRKTEHNRLVLFFTLEPRRIDLNPTNG
jgi:hypothetical protein